MRFQMQKKQREGPLQGGYSEQKLQLLLPAWGCRRGTGGEIPRWELSSPMHLEAKPDFHEEKKKYKRSI